MNSPTSDKNEIHPQTKQLPKGNKKRKAVKINK